MGKSPIGSILSFKHKNCDLTLMGCSYSRVSGISLVDALAKSNPDCILVQVRPELKSLSWGSLSGFNMFMKNRSGVFSDSEYLKQLELDQKAIEVLPFFPKIH